MKFSPFVSTPALTAAILLALSAGGAAGSAAGAAVPAKASAPSRSAPTTCRGLAADVVPAGEDYVGTDADDVILVLAPGSEVWGNYGNDLICLYGDSYHGAVVHGGPEDDTIVSYSGSHTISGDAGEDTVVANGGSMEVEGGDDDDILNVGGATSATVYGGAGHDIINGSPGNDTLYGDEGNDLLRGGQGWDGHSGGVGTDDCQDSSSAIDGGMFGECESVFQSPAASDGFAFG